MDGEGRGGRLGEDKKDKGKAKRQLGEVLGESGGGQRQSEYGLVSNLERGCSGDSPAILGRFFFFPLGGGYH